ncbi:MAG: diguanylate cyclase [Hydrogenophaga sp.]|nr:diguanylate cyclase [Hydrogenophaga sp.]
MGVIAIVSGRTLVQSYESSITAITARMSPIFVAQDLLYQIEAIATTHALGLDTWGVEKPEPTIAEVSENFRIFFDAQAKEHPATPSAGRLSHELFAAWRQSQDSLNALFGKDAGTRNAIDAYSLARTDIANVNALVAQVRQLSILELQQRINAGRAIADKTLYFLSSAVLLGLLVLTVVIFIFSRSVLEPIGRLTVAADKIGRKDLSYRVILRNKDDELGRLGEVLNTSTKKLQELYRELDRRSTHDGLTGVLNRAAFDESLSAVCLSADRDKTPVSLLLIDIDFFKSINDTYGHQAGDHVLKWVAGAVANAMRPGDTIARYGGEEFAAILPDTSGAGAMAMAERIRTIVESLSIETDAGERILVTVSIGLKTRDPETLTPASYIRLADDALYRAKGAGRNRTVSANQYTQPPPSISHTA